MNCANNAMKMKNSCNLFKTESFLFLHYCISNKFVFTQVFEVLNTHLYTFTQWTEL